MGPAEKLFNWCLVLYMAVFATMSILIYFDAFGVYQEEWSARFEALALSTGNDANPDYGRWDAVGALAMLLLLTLSLLGLYKRRLWAVYSFSAMVVAGLVLGACALGTVSYDDALVSTANYVHSLIEGSILTLIWVFREEVGFPKRLAERVLANEG